MPQVSVLSYKKSSEKIVRLLCELIRKQLSMLMLTVDIDTISKLFTNVLLPALRETQGMRSVLMHALDSFCEECFDNFIAEKSIFTVTQHRLRAKLVEFYDEYSEIFEVLLSMLITQLFFED